MNVNGLYIVIIAHFIGDFVLQSDWMATNKSKLFEALCLHIVVYFVTLICAGIIVFGAQRGDAIIYFALLNASLHMVIDFITSQITSDLWKRNKRHWFFTTIGFDQMIHMILIIATLNLF